MEQRNTVPDAPENIELRRLHKKRRKRGKSTSELII